MDDAPVIYGLEDFQVCLVDETVAVMARSGLYIMFISKDSMCYLALYYYPERLTSLEEVVLGLFP